MEPITLVWNRDRCWEEDWIEYLFQHIPHKTIDNIDHLEFIDRSVIIDSLPWAPYHNGYMAEMHRRGLKYGLIHLSDESRSDDISSYAGCQFVLRNYIRSGTPDNCYNILLGYNTKFTVHTHNPSILDRKYMWSTIIHRWDYNRQIMVQQADPIPNGFLYVVNHHGPRLSVEEYSGILRDSIFVLCPNGALIPDSFRITEAMEAGAIPVVQANDHWKIQYGDNFPAVIIHSWQELAEKLIALMLNPSQLERKRQQCVSWWDKKKKENLNMVTEVVTKTLGNEG